MLKHSPKNVFLAGILTIQLCPLPLSKIFNFVWPGETELAETEAEQAREAEPVGIA